MTSSHSEETVYRFATFAARGTITLRSDCVHNKTRTHLGSWEQTIPLTELKPSYGTLSTTPGILVWASIFAIIFLATGVHGLIFAAAAVGQKMVSVFMIAAGLVLGSYLFKHRKSDWIMFNAFDSSSRLGYTRQGPDADKCELFTSQLVTAIRSANVEQHQLS